MIIEKPWGNIKAYALNQPCTVKLITIKEGQETSLHYHKLRDDIWIVMDDGLQLTIGEKELLAEAGTEYLIPAEELHKICSLGKAGRVLEIGVGFTSEDDTYRIKDEYGRRLEEREEETL